MRVRLELGSYIWLWVGLFGSKIPLEVHEAFELNAAEC